ncbi:MAG: hypothetical protein ACR2FX_05440 [Chthoniobacterales bacterium]
MANIVEGSVQKAANTVRVNVQLIHAATDAHVWADTYDRKLDDLFGVQSEVAGAIANQLNAKLSPNEQGPEYATHHQSAGLRRLAARCRPLHQRVAKSRRNGSRRSSSWSKLDPGFAAAWALLSQCYSSQYFQGYVVTDARRQGPKRHLITLCNWPPTRRRHSARAALRILDSTDYAAAIGTFTALSSR